MKFKKILAILLASGLLLGIPSMSTYAATELKKTANTLNTAKLQAANYDYSTETLTADSQYVSSSQRLISGYAKDAQGNPLVNRTIVVVYCSDFYALPNDGVHKIISGNADNTRRYYTTLNTDSNGYYSFYANENGYYQMYLTFGTISDLDVYYINQGSEQWPSCNWIVTGTYNYESDVRVNAYAAL